MDSHRIVRTLHRYRTFIIAAHVNVDPDALGSQLALFFLLKRLKKKVRLVTTAPVPEYLTFLPGVRRIEQCSGLSGDIRADVLIALDTPTPARLGDAQSLIGKVSTVITIDHHISNTRYGVINWVQPNVSSCGEMIYQLYRILRAPITKPVAECLYVAILTDTGRFTFENTSAKTHRIAAELLSRGVRAHLTAQKVYERTSAPFLKLLRDVLTTFTVSDDGRVASMVLTRRMKKKYGISYIDSEDFLAVMRPVRGVELILLFRQDRPGLVQVSLRSKSFINVNTIAASFGGGGHPKAAGCTVSGTLPAVQKKMLKVVYDTIR